MPRFPRVSDEDIAAAGRFNRTGRNVEVLEIYDGEASPVSEATAAIRLRVDIRGRKPVFFALSPPLAKHISRALRRAAKDYMSNVKNSGRGGPRGRAAGDYRR